TVVCTAASRSDDWVTSQRTARTDSPSSSAVSLAPASSMSAITTLAPRATNRVAMALPRPWAPPVTNARLPSSSAIAHLLLVGGRCRSAWRSAVVATTEGWIEKTALLWRALQVAVGFVGVGEKVALHGPPHLEGDDGPFQVRPRQLLEPAEAVTHGVLVDVERLGGRLDRQAVLDEGGDGLEDRLR